MIGKKKSLLSKKIGETRRRLRGKKGRRETKHHFSGTILKDNQF
jgi:hypothetical protein